MAERKDFLGQQRPEPAPYGCYSLRGEAQTYPSRKEWQTCLGERVGVRERGGGALRTGKTPYLYIVQRLFLYFICSLSQFRY